MFIALFPNFSKKTSTALAERVSDFFKGRGCIVVSDEETSKRIGTTALKSEHFSKIECIISIGGDGSILQLVHKYPEINCPILGINAGHLGFMADVPVDDLEESLFAFVKGLYKVDERLTLEGKTADGESMFAVNDIVVHRGRNASLIELAIHIDGTYVNNFVADGLIITTPNGSTAYSLAAGGPIITPTLEALMITPICPHTISNRPLIIHSSQEISVTYLSEYDPIEITVDGFKSYLLHTNGTFRIKKSPRPFKLITLDRRDYFSTLRTKLGWFGKRV